MKPLQQQAREHAKDIKPPEWQEGDKTFFYPTLDNHMRLGLHDLLIAMAGRIEELEQVLAKLRTEAEQTSMFYPTDLALMQEEINAVLPQIPLEGGR